MEEFYRFVLHYLMPAALLGLVAAIVLLVLRRKKDGVRPPHARTFLIIALILIGFAIVTLIVIPIIHYTILFFEIGTELFYAALK